jgi:histone acetyltransferase (RNA polymerase elongator complex component)
VESGDNKILHDTCKGVNAEEMERAGKRLIEAGIELCAIILIGLGGKDRSAENAHETASIINRIKPAQLAAMTYTPVPGTRMFTQIQKGEFHPLDAKGALQETRALVADLDVDGLYFTSNHVSNAISASCVLPKDKDTLLHALDNAIANTPNSSI